MLLRGKSPTYRRLSLDSQAVSDRAVAERGATVRQVRDLPRISMAEPFGTALLSGSGIRSESSGTLPRMSLVEPYREALDADRNLWCLLLAAYCFLSPILPRYKALFVIDQHDGSHRQLFVQPDRS